MCADNDNSNNKRFSCTGLYIFKFIFCFFFSRLCFHSMAGAAIVKKKNVPYFKEIVQIGNVV